MLSDVWQDFLKIVKEEAGSRVVETWLKAVTFDQWDLENKVVYIKAPNTFVKDWIQNNYTELFKQHFARLLNVEKLKIIFLSDTDQKENTKDSLGKIILAKEAPAEPIELKKHALIKKTFSFHVKLNPEYKFETFVVGPNNSLAYAAAHAVAEDPGTLYNPLFIYGKSGLGKTHLLHAIGNELQKKTDLIVLYQTADRFVNEFINAIRFNKFHRFQEKYRKLDVLLIDDVQFFSGKEQTQEAFFHIFNMLHDAGKQIVFSSDIFPRKIEGLADRLRSRLEWGLVTDIYKPPLETKIAILKKKASIHGQVLEDSIAEYIASHSENNVRELEGALIRILAYVSLTKQPLSKETVEKVLSPQKNNSPKKCIVDFSKIANTVCRHYSYRLEDLRSTSRAKELSLVRQIAMYLMKKMTEKSLREIGTFLGRKDHSTVIHAFEKIKNSVQQDAILGRTIKTLEETILR